MKSPKCVTCGSAECGLIIDGGLYRCAKCVIDERDKLAARVKVLESDAAIASTATYIGAIADAASVDLRTDAQLVDHMVRLGGILPDRPDVKAAMRRISSASTKKIIRDSWKRKAGE